MMFQVAFLERSFVLCKSEQKTPIQNMIAHEMTITSVRRITKTGLHSKTSKFPVFSLLPKAHCLRSALQAKGAGEATRGESTSSKGIIEVPQDTAKKRD